jgi:OOP family OmpA-OmpF porin
MTGKKVVFPAFTAATLGLAVLAYGCHEEMSIGSPKNPDPPPTVAAMPTPAPTPTPPPVETPPPPPAPKQIKLKGGNLKGNQIEMPGDIEFASNSDKFNDKEPKTNVVLNTVLQILNDNPQVTKLRIEGHTDNEGGNTINKPLSDKRAAAVVKWLVGKGVAESRLHSVGFGSDCPLAANDTAANKKMNRRTEFRLEEMDSKPLDGDNKDAKGCSVAAGASGATPAATPATGATPAASAAPVGGTGPKPASSATPKSK